METSSQGQRMYGSELGCRLKQQMKTQKSQTPLRTPAIAQSKILWGDCHGTKAFRFKARYWYATKAKRLGTRYSATTSNQSPVATNQSAGVSRRFYFVGYGAYNSLSFSACRGYQETCPSRYSGISYFGISNSRYHIFGILSCFPARFESDRYAVLSTRSSLVVGNQSSHSMLALVPSRSGPYPLTYFDSIQLRRGPSVNFRRGFSAIPRSSSISNHLAFRRISIGSVSH